MSEAFKCVLSLMKPAAVDQYLPDCVLLLLHPCTLGNDQLMAALMDHTGAHCGRNTHRHKKHVCRAAVCV